MVLIVHIHACRHSNTEPLFKTGSGVDLGTTPRKRLERSGLAAICFCWPLVFASVQPSLKGKGLWLCFGIQVDLCSISGNKPALFILKA